MADALQSFSLPEWRVVVVDNASTDRTAQVVTELGLQSVTSRTIAERGKGAALIAAARASSADIFGFIEADLSADPMDMRECIARIASGEADVVIGSRLLDTQTVHRGFFRSFSSRLFNLLRRVILGIDVVDSQCGLKLMNRKGTAHLAQCRETGWFLDLEFLARAEKLGLRIREMSVHWDEDRFPKRVSKLRVLRDGVQALVAMVRIRRSLVAS